MRRLWEVVVLLMWGVLEMVEMLVWRTLEVVIYGM